MLKPMGKLLMLRDDDDRRIQRLKRRLRARSKAEVVRLGLDLLEQEGARRALSDRLRRAARLARDSSAEFLAEVSGTPRRGLG